MTKRVLIISYPFPPVGGAGVQRATKFVKYLPAHGWQTSVLTVANPSVPAYDRSLESDIPAETIVRRGKSWEPGYALKAAVGGGSDNAKQSPSMLKRMARAAKELVRRGTKLLVLQPDAQILWLPGAVRAGRQLLAEIPHAAIVATGPPFSTFLIAARLSRKANLPLVLDYRDEWDLSSAYWENKRLDFFSRSLQDRMQRSVVRAAKVITATTQASAAALEAIRDRAGSDARVTWIYNGYDEEDFPVESTPSTDPKEPYRLAYVGTLWNLTSVEGLVNAVERLATGQPELASHLELVFAGRRTDTQDKILDRLHGTATRIVRHPYLDHRGAVELMRTAGGLAVILSDLPGAGRVVPAKIFECMAARRPVLVVAPRGELWDIVVDYPHGRCFEPGNHEGIASWLAGEVQRHRQGAPLDFKTWDGARFSRRNQAGELAGLLDSLC